MSQTLSAGITRDRAFELLNEHNKDPFHITHGETVEGTMRYFAREFDPENEEFWGIVGLLHDLDWEEHEDDPVNHTIYAAEILEGEGASPELIRAIQTHTSDFNTSLPKPELQMEKILFACDELTGLIGAAVIMRPSKSVMDFTTKSLKKKFKDKRFAAGCSRDVITQGAEMLGWELPELFDRTIAAMQSFAPDRDTFQAYPAKKGQVYFGRFYLGRRFRWTLFSGSVFCLTWWCLRMAAPRGRQLRFAVSVTR